jgi:hypothetical protein
MRSGSIPPHLELAAWNGGSRPKLTPWQKFRSLSGASPPIASLTSALQRLSVALAQSARGFPAFAGQPKLYCIYWALDGVKVLVGRECQIARTVGRHCSNLLFCQLVIGMVIALAEELESIAGAWAATFFATYHNDATACP